MKQFLLLLATVISWVGAVVLFLMGLRMLLTGPAGVGFLFLLIAAPLSIAQAIVFQYVRNRLNDARALPRHAATGVHPDTEGTPWERNPGHTL